MRELLYEMMKYYRSLDGKHGDPVIIQNLVDRYNPWLRQWMITAAIYGLLS